MTLMENAEALFDAPPLAEQERMVEAILFASAEPLSLAQIGERLPHGSDAGAALERLKRLMGVAIEWGQLASFLPESWSLDPAKRRSAIASTFAASLELAKLGRVEIRQEETFAPIYLRARQPDGGGQ